MYESTCTVLAMVAGIFLAFGWFLGTVLAWTETKPTKIESNVYTDQYCPFCGHDRINAWRKVDGTFEIECAWCKAKVVEFDQEEAVTNWEKRYEEP